MSDFDLALTLESDEPGFRFKVVRADSGMLPTLAAAFTAETGRKGPRHSFLFETRERRQIMAEYLDAHGYRRDEILHGSWVTICDWSTFVDDAR